MTSARRWCGVTITYLELCLADKKRQRQGLCFCTTSVWSRRKKSNCSPTGVLTLVCPGLCVCVFVCVFVRCLCALLSFDVAPMLLAVAPLRLCRRCSQIMPKARRRFNWENRRADFPLLQPIPIFLDLAVSTALLLPTPYISPLFLSPFPSRS